MKNSAGRGGRYPPRPKAEVDNILRDLQNSSYPTKAEFNNCFIIHSKYFQTVKQRKSDGTKGVFLSTSVHPFFSHRRKTFVKLPLTPLQL